MLNRTWLHQAAEPLPLTFLGVLAGRTFIFSLKSETIRQSGEHD